MRPVSLMGGLSLLLLFQSPAGMALTLDQFWQQARAHDPRLQAYREQLEVASQARPLALAALLPQVGVGASEQWGRNSVEEPYNDFRPNGPLVVEKSQARTSTWSVQIRQALFNWSAIQKYRVSDAQVAAAAAQYQQSFQGLEEQVVAAYARWLLAYANLQSLREAERGFARQAFTAQARYRAGTTGILGADEAQVALGRIQAQEAQAQAAWRAAEAKLQQFTGRLPPSQAPALPKNIQVAEHILSQWQDQATRHNPTLAAAQDQLAAARRGVSAAWGGFLPTLSLLLAHQWQSQQGSLGYQVGSRSVSGLGNPYRNIGSSVMLQMRWTIFSGGSQQASLAQAQYQEEENFSTLLATERNIHQALRSSYASLQGALRQAAFYRNSLMLAKRASAAAEDGVRVGLVSENNAIIDRQNVLSVRNDLNAANANAVISYASLAATAGVLTPQKLEKLSLALAIPEEKRP